MGKERGGLGLKVLLLLFEGFMTAIARGRRGEISYFREESGKGEHI